MINNSTKNRYWCHHCHNKTLFFCHSCNHVQEHNDNLDDNIMYFDYGPSKKECQEDNGLNDDIMYFDNGPPKKTKCQLKERPKKRMKILDATHLHKISIKSLTNELLSKLLGCAKIGSVWYHVSPSQHITLGSIKILKQEGFVFNDSDINSYQFCWGQATDGMALIALNIAKRFWSKQIPIILDEAAKQGKTTTDICNYDMKTYLEEWFKQELEDQGYKMSGKTVSW